MQDGNMGPSPYGYMCKFERDIPPSYKNNASGQCLKLQKLIALREMFRPGKRQGSRHCPGRDQYVGAFQKVMPHCYRCRSNKTRTAMECLDACAGKVLRKELWRWLRFRAFKAHQLLPVNGSIVCTHPLACHTRCCVNDFGRTH